MKALDKDPRRRYQSAGEMAEDLRAFRELRSIRELRPSRLGHWNGVAYYVIVAVPVMRDALGLAWPGAALVQAFGWLLVASTLVSMADRLRVALSSE